MTIALNVQADFAVILDGAEPITLNRRDSATTIAIATAWRLSSHTSDAESAGGHVAQWDVVWQFPWEAADELPRMGDTLIDAAGDCFTILSLDQLPAATRLRCVTRNLSVVYQLADRVEVQIAILQDTGGGPTIVGWRTLRAAVPARIQPLRLEVDNTTSPASATETYRILFGERLELDANCRFVDGPGNVYQLIEYIQAERIDALPVATVTKSATAP